MSADKDTNGAETEGAGAVEAPKESWIIKTIEDFFSDESLSGNKVIMEQVKLDNGWIPMSTMLEFQQLATLSSKSDVIANAVKSSQLVEVDTTGTEVKLRRSPEMPLSELNPERRKSIISRTIYCKRFPLDIDMDAVMNILKPHGNPENILMRKYKDTVTQKYMFKGSILVTFKTPEEAKAFYEKEDVKVGDTVLEKLWQNDYNEMKKMEKLMETKNVQKEKENAKQKDFHKGATIRLSGNLKGVHWKDIQKALEDCDVVEAQIDMIPRFPRQNNAALFIRLPEENSAKAAVEKMTDELTVKDNKMTVRIVEGTEEEEYHERARRGMMKSLEKKEKVEAGGRKRIEDNRNDPNEEPPAKKTKYTPAHPRSQLPAPQTGETSRKTSSKN